MSHEYFFELLVEEIPAWMLPHPALDRALSDLVAGEIGVGAEGRIETGATSRRLFFVIRDLPDRQADRRVEVKGPPVKTAFDTDGKPTKALEGFLRKNEASIDQVVRDGDYVRLEKTVVGRAAKEILAERIPSIVEALRWPKMMRWGRGEHSFIRPVHSVISIFDGQHLPLSVFGVASGVTTVGHRVIDRGTHRIASFDDYVSRMRTAKVFVRAGEREEQMRRRARELAAEVGGTPREDESIWEQWRYLTEYPGMVRAEFPAEYLELPEEVLITVMRVHQKQLPVIRDGKLSSSLPCRDRQRGRPRRQRRARQLFRYQRALRRRALLP
jgi:glycyl-tRNA synthetase beta chain